MNRFASGKINRRESKIVNGEVEREKGWSRGDNRFRRFPRQSHEIFLFGKLGNLF